MVCWEKSPYGKSSSKTGDGISVNSGGGLPSGGGNTSDKLSICIFGLEGSVSGGDEIEVSGFDLGTAWDGVGMAGSGIFGSGLAEVEQPGAGILGAGMLGTGGIPVEVWEGTKVLGTTGTPWVGGVAVTDGPAGAEWLGAGVRLAGVGLCTVFTFSFSSLLVFWVVNTLTIGCGNARCIEAGFKLWGISFYWKHWQNQWKIVVLQRLFGSVNLFYCVCFLLLLLASFLRSKYKTLGCGHTGWWNGCRRTWAGFMFWAFSFFWRPVAEPTGRFLSFRDFLVVFISFTWSVFPHSYLLVFWGVNTNFLGVVPLTGEADTGVRGLESSSGDLVFGATGRTSGKFLSFSFCLKVLTCLLSSRSSLLMGWLSLVLNPQGGESWRLRFLSSLKTTRGAWSDPFCTCNIDGWDQRIAVFCWWRDGFGFLSGGRFSLDLQTIFTLEPCL